MTGLDFLGHIGYALLLFGSWQLGNRQRRGFLFRVVGSLLWVVIGWELAYSSIVVWSLVFAGVDLRAHRLWGGEA